MANWKLWKKVAIIVAKIINAVLGKSGETEQVKKP